VLIEALGEPTASRDTVIAAQTLLEQLRTSARPTSSRWTEERPAVPPSRWAHVPLQVLLAEGGNTVQMTRSGGRSGHEPAHSSASGSCIWFSPATGWWKCASCGKRGDAVALFASLHGLSYRDAARTLARRFGRPQQTAAPKLPRPKPLRRIFHGA
jgi:hypothetical protein